MTSRARWLTLALAVTAVSTVAEAQTLDSATVAGMRWRNVGPANFMGRLSDVVGIPSPSKTLFVAAAAGGIWKTTNNGFTWRPVFDDKRVISMGMLAIAPSDTQQVWAGTGEPNSRNSIEPGGGIYKSTDGGITWTLKGLEKTEHIGRIVVHPTNPNIVFVAALGAAWRSNPERGLYRTTDGGTTWQLVKSVSDKAGFIDVAINQKDPNILFAASWERLRTPYSLKSGGPGSALFKSTDGGTTWNEVKGGGWPDGVKGRIGLDINRSNPNVIYAMLEGTAADVKGNYEMPGRAPRDNGLWRSTDGGGTWTKMNSINVRPFYYSQVRSDPKNADRVYFSSTQLQVSDDGGKTPRDAAQNVHVDTHGLWIDPNDSERWVIANDGGIAFTYDKGGNFNQMQNLPLGQFYEVAFDMAVPYNICSGAQDNGTWCGPSKRRAGQTTLGYWYTIAGGDGFYAAMDPTDPNIVYGESQGGNASRLNLKTGERMQFTKPSWQATYKRWEDSIAVLQGDPLVPVSKPTATAIASLRAKQKQDSIDLSLRFNWNSPFFISPHNPAVIYFGGNRVLKSVKRGEDFNLISPDLSKKLEAKIDTSLRLTGGITADATGAETYGTVVAMEESPVKPGLIFAGTDDGNVWKSVNDGATWENLSAKFASFLPNNGEVVVARIEASKFDTATFYVAFDNHRWGDFKPYLFVTNDGGKSFKSLVNNLPTGGSGDFLHVIREDPNNRNLLFVGSSLGVYASIDRGTSWTKFTTNFPSVPVYDLQIHPRDHELIAATHGRSLWIVDITPLEQMTSTVVAKSVHLFEPKTAFQWGEAPTLGASGNGNAQAFFATPNPAYGASLSYRVTGTGGPTARISVVDAQGDTLQSLTGPGTPGLHTVTWSYGITPRPQPRAPLSASEKRDSILRAVRGPVVLDSLTKAKYDSAALVQAKALLNQSGPPAGGFPGAGGGGGGRGAGAACERPLTQWEPFCARPAEAAPGGGRGAGGGGGGRGGGAPSAAVLKIFQLIGIAAPGGGGGRGGGGGFGGGGGRNASTGDYMVILQVGGTVVKQKLHVENVGAGEAGSPFGPASGDEDARGARSRARIR
ncbi:MAG: hypothetical protein IPP90_06605 [Gemmatimonadaceae bacterium]|nr:hypothetical protein [Gemmatimonadaceae bacterium]